MTNGLNSLKINLAALRRNLARVRAQIAPGTRIMGIVKSDAYGHGLIPVARALEKGGVDCLGVAFLEEALKLRAAGITGLPVIILAGIQDQEGARQTAANALTPVIYDFWMAEALDREGARMGKKIPVHIKIDTGMGRLGIPHLETGDFLERIICFDNIQIEALTSHLSSADEQGREFTRRQIDCFREAVVKGKSLGLNLTLNNLANSAGIMSYRDSHFDMVRPGIMLYGGLPSPGFQTRVNLEPVMTFSGRVLQVRAFPDQTPLSYGRTFYTHGQKKMAVVSAGYSDGLPRCLSNRGQALIKGRPAPLVGRICMNLLLGDISDIPGVLPGDKVLFLGVDNGEIISGDDLAGWCETISYEIFCSLGRGSHKVYIDEDTIE